MADLGRTFQDLEPNLDLELVVTSVSGGWIWICTSRLDLVTESVFHSCGLACAGYAAVCVPSMQCPHAGAVSKCGLLMCARSGLGARAVGKAPGRPCGCHLLIHA